jgi:hypothetical protein
MSAFRSEADVVRNALNVRDEPTPVMANIVLAGLNASPGRDELPAASHLLASGGRSKPDLGERFCVADVSSGIDEMPKDALAMHHSYCFCAFGGARIVSTID